MKGLSRTLLIIEDEPEMRELLSLVFQSEHDFSKIKVARNLAEAEMEMRKNRPDLVLLDEVIPFEPIEGFIKMLNQESIPCILLTSLQNREGSGGPLTHGRVMKPTLKNFKSEKNAFLQKIRQLLDSKTIQKK